MLASIPVGRAIAVIMTMIICCLSQGCSSDVGTQTADCATKQPRYFGGPKSPMWPAQQ